MNNSIQGVYSLEDLQSDELLIDGTPVLEDFEMKKVVEVVNMYGKKK